MGVMISAFQHQTFGFGRPMNGEELQKVNEKRAGGQYLDKDAAILKHGTKNKQPLTSSPFMWNSNMEHKKRVTGPTITLFNNVKTLQTVSKYCTPIY